jgi:hypothetical protein
VENADIIISWTISEVRLEDPAAAEEVEDIPEAEEVFILA